MEGKVMKKYFAIIALASLTLVACEKVQEFFDDSNDVTTIYAIAGADRTKTTVSGLNVYWSTGDVVAVANEDNDVVEFTLKGEGGSAEASFEGTLGGKALGTYAVYPSTTNSAVAGNTVTVDYLTTWAYGKTELPMWGKRVSEYSFYNVGGAVLVTYSNVPATTNDKYFVFTSNNNITGTVTVSNLDSTPSVNTPNGGNTVTITGISGSATSVSVIVPVPAGTGYNFTAQLKEATTNTVVPGTQKTATDKTITKNIITKFDDVDLTPVISNPSPSSFEVPYTATTDHSISYSIANVAAGEVVTASANVTWINNFNVTTGTVTFDVDANYYNSPDNGIERDGTITLTYAGAISKTINVNQAPAPVITASPTSFSLAGNQAHSGNTINYSISNVASGAKVTATSNQDSITISSTTESTVVFTTAKKFTSGTITLSYLGAENVVITVTNTK